MIALPGLWADGETPEDVRETLAEVVEDWLMLKMDRGERDIPVIETIDLNRL
jgi:predicted RNase H-like HicB family nuclease